MSVFLPRQLGLGRKNPRHNSPGRRRRTGAIHHRRRHGSGTRDREDDLTIPTYLGKRNRRRRIWEWNIYSHCFLLFLFFFTSIVILKRQETNHEPHPRTQVPCYATLKKGGIRKHNPRFSPPHIYRPSGEESRTNYLTLGTLPNLTLATLRKNMQYHTREEKSR
jgi:hypothetical protein